LSAPGGKRILRDPGKATWLALFSLVVCVGSSEVAVRWFEPKEVMRYFYVEDSNILDHKFRPNAVGRYKTLEFDTDYAINSLGLRDHEYTVPKPPRTFRILMLGDSFTEGDGGGTPATVTRDVIGSDREVRTGPVPVIRLAQGGEILTRPGAGAASRWRTLPPGTALPSHQACAGRVSRSSWEPRPDNEAANHRVPTAEQIARLAPWNPTIGVDPRANNLLRHIKGDFTGTTDEIIQWAACAWGIDEDVVRAVAVVESYWHQGHTGDYTSERAYCPSGTWDGQGCYQSYGLLQVKYSPFPSAWPMSRDDTAFSVEYSLGVVRTCYEGWTTYLNDRPPDPGYPPYHAGDLWGCLGRWYSGSWYDAEARGYMKKVQAAYKERAWLQPRF
jgi:hypothetical protein